MVFGSCSHRPLLRFLSPLPTHIFISPTHFSLSHRFLILLLLVIVSASRTTPHFTTQQPTCIMMVYVVAYVTDVPQISFETLLEEARLYAEFGFGEEFSGLFEPTATIVVDPPAIDFCPILNPAPRPVPDYTLDPDDVAELPVGATPRHLGSFSPCPGFSDAAIQIRRQIEHLHAQAPKRPVSAALITGGTWIRQKIKGPDDKAKVTILLLKLTITLVRPAPKYPGSEPFEIVHFELPIDPWSTIHPRGYHCHLPGKFITGQWLTHVATQYYHLPSPEQLLRLAKSLRFEPACKLQEARHPPSSARYQQWHDSRQYRQSFKRRQVSTLDTLANANARKRVILDSVKLNKSDGDTSTEDKIIEEATASVVNGTAVLFIPPAVDDEDQDFWKQYINWDGYLNPDAKRQRDVEALRKRYLPISIPSPLCSSFTAADLEEVTNLVPDKDKSIEAVPNLSPCTSFDTILSDLPTAWYNDNDEDDSPIVFDFDTTPANEETNGSEPLEDFLDGVLSFKKPRHKY